MNIRMAFRWWTDSGQFLCFLGIMSRTSLVCDALYIGRRKKSIGGIQASDAIAILEAIRLVHMSVGKQRIWGRGYLGQF